MSLKNFINNSNHGYINTKIVVKIVYIIDF